MSRRERGNGQGSVTALKDSKGKKKYQVRVTVSSKFDVEKERVIYTSKSLGVFKTKAEAEAVLAEYNSSPYDLTTKIMKLDFDTSNKKKADKAKTKDNKKKKSTKSKTVANKKTTETTEVSTNSEATKDTAEVASTDVSSDNGVSSEATADASSDTSVATNEDSASDSSEADADPAKDVSDGTEVVA